MLEGLNSIDWKSRHAELVPDWIRQLASSEQTVWTSAADNLDEKVVKINHQDHDTGKGISRILNTDLPILIIPFLIEILDSGTSEAKVAILEMLTAMSRYKRLEFEGEEYHNRMLKVREEIWTGFDVYKQLLESLNHDERKQAFTLLFFLSEHFDGVIPILVNAFEKETNMNAKEWMQRYDLAPKN